MVIQLAAIVRRGAIQQLATAGKAALDILGNWQFATAASMPRGNSSALGLHWLEGLAAPALATVLKSVYTGKLAGTEISK